MTTENLGQATFYALLLLLPLSALVARRIDWRRGAAMMAGWVAIFVVAFALFAERDRLALLTTDLRQALDPETPVRHGAEFLVPIAADGHFWVHAEVNGRPFRFLIDSGASTTALSTDAARASDVKPDSGFGGGFGVPIETANGQIVAHRATIGRLAIGTSLVRRNLAVVIAPEFGETNVLGMNFLSSLRRWGVERGMLVLVP